MRLLKSVTYLLPVLAIFAPLAARGSQGSATLKSAASRSDTYTKRDVLMLAAKAAIDEGHPHDIEGCSDTQLEGDELLSCVYVATNMSTELVYLPESTFLHGIIEVSYYDYSGDCALYVKVDADRGMVKDVSEWNCI